MLFPESFEWETSEIVNGGRRGSFAVPAWFRKVAYDRDILIYIMLVLCWGNVISGGKHLYTVRVHYELMSKVENN